MIIEIYENTITIGPAGKLSEISMSDKAPAKCLLRTLWVFEVRADHKLTFSLRRVIWQCRTSARHKWISERAWYWNTNDISVAHCRRSSSAEKPEVPALILVAAEDAIIAALTFEENRK